MDVYSAKMASSTPSDDVCREAMKCTVEKVAGKILEVLECWVMGMSTTVLWEVFEEGVAGDRMHLSKRNNVHHLGQRRTRCNGFRAQNKSPNSIFRIVHLL